MNFENTPPTSKASEFIFQQENFDILKACQELTTENIKELMKVSDKLAQLNFERFQNFEQMPEKQAIFAYDGDVYNNIGVNIFSSDQLDFAQDNVRIISGFYGLLKPLDMIKPYRLEMVTNIKRVAPKGLARFWVEKITAALNGEIKQHKNPIIINLASNEYSAAIDHKKLAADIINIHFRENRNNKIANIALNAKRARGMMVDYIVKNYIDHPDMLKDFNYNDYKFVSKMSDKNNYYFVM